MTLKRKVISIMTEHKHDHMEDRKGIGWRKRSTPTETKGE
jgi:hypothetical protein